jgi:hypothetical protein
MKSPLKFDAIGYSRAGILPTNDENDKLIKIFEFEGFDWLETRCLHPLSSIFTLIF